MCEEKCCPEGKKPEECSEEKVKECHGEDKEHTCCQKPESEEKKEEDE